MVQIADIVDEVYDAIEWQRQPINVDKRSLRAMLHNMVVDAIMYLYIKTGRDGLYNDGMYELIDDVPIVFKPDLKPAERQFVKTYATILFTRKVRSEVDNIVGYTTDAMTITNADKPFAYLTQVINEQNELLRELYYKMIDYSLL